MPENFIIAYPDDGSRKTDLPKGITEIDFWEGEVTDSGATTTTLKRKLKNSPQSFIRSIAILCSQDTKIWFEGMKVFGEAGNWAVFENLNIRYLRVETSITESPDEIDFQFIASTSRKIAVPQIGISTIKRSKAATASANAYATAFERFGAQFNHHSLVIRETGGVNGITYKLETKHASGGTYVIVPIAGNDETPLAASGSDVVQIEGEFPYLKLSFKSTVGGAHGELTAEYSAKL